VFSFANPISKKYANDWTFYNPLNIMKLSSEDGGRARQDSRNTRIFLGKEENFLRCKKCRPLDLANFPGMSGIL
jgi:hypothetical protein